jgi:hypothetical protein
MADDVEGDREYSNLDADRQQVTQELDQLGMDPDQFEEIHAEFRQFLNEIIGD